MTVTRLSAGTVSRAKRAFTTRRVPDGDMKTLINGRVRPVSGDLVLASVQQIGEQTELEQWNGRHAQLLPGDEIIVCYGSRYAPDQYEAVISEDLGLCDLIAAGGLASREINRHDRILPPTKIMPIGIVGDENGKRLNVADYGISQERSEKPIKVIVVVGTGMNSGETFTAASIIHGLKSTPYKVAGIKATGTGAAGDVFLFQDMGADVVLDFTDGGLSSTYLQPDDDIERTTLALIDHAARQDCDVAIIEIADGILHKETETLLRSKSLQARVFGVVFGAYDAVGAKAGHDLLREWGYNVLAISGQLTRSPLAMRQAAHAVEAEIITPFQIQAGALMPYISGASGVMGSKLDNENVFIADTHSSRIINDFDFDDTEYGDELPEPSQVLKSG